ncbi:MAG TPA: hypothetical protein PK069_01725 [Methanolinea sp.]|nr:hypothetical protein [Methanolinea sp.]
MKRGHLIAGFVGMVVCAIMIQGAAAGTLERSIEPADHSTFRVTLTIPGDTVAGITEILPDGMEILQVSLPPHQYHVNGTTLSLAVIGEREITYLVRGSGDPTGSIRGTWTDYLSGEVGSVAEHGDEMRGPELPPAVPLASGTPKASPSLLLSGTAFAIACVVMVRARRRDE